MKNNFYSEKDNNILIDFQEKNENYKPKSNKKNHDYIFRPYITTKDGKRIFAKDYGHKAWKIPVFELNKKT